MAVACINKQTSALEFGKGRSAWNRFLQADRFKEETEKEKMRQILNCCQVSTEIIRLIE